MNDYFERLGSEYGALVWISQVFVVIFIALLADYMQKRAVNRLHERLLKTPQVWDDALVEAVRRPLSLLIWVLGIALAADILHQTSGFALFAAVDPLREVGVIVAITWFLLRLVRGVEANIIQLHAVDDRPYDRTSVDAIGKLTRVSIFITSSLVALQTLGFSVSGVLAFGGIGGIAVGFAAKDLLANFFGGLMIYLDRPFAVGDWVRSPDREIEGVVEDIGWRLTRIRTFDKRPVYVPNATFASIAVVNPSRMTHRRIYETIGVRYSDVDVVAKIVEEVKAMLMAHEDIDTSETMIVNVNGFGPSSIDFFVYTFTRTVVWVEYHAAKQRILLEIAEIIRRNGAEIAFPTSTIHLPDGIALHGEASAGVRP